MDLVTPNRFSIFQGFIKVLHDRFLSSVTMKRGEKVFSCVTAL